MSLVSCPTKIPEYIVTGNSVVLHNYIGDFGLSLNDKNYAIVKKNNQAIIDMDIEELARLAKPNAEEIASFSSVYSFSNSLKNNESLFKKINEYLNK